MQVIYSKTLKIFALLNLFFLVRQKKNQKTPGCIVDFFHYFFIHWFLQGFAVQKSTRSEKKWNLKSKTLGRIFYFTRA